MEEFRGSSQRIDLKPKDWQRGWILSKSSISDGCWEWQKDLNYHGYGILRLRGKRLSAHRLSYELFCGPIVNELHVLHRCDNPKCIRPDHLFLGTEKDNGIDAARKDRRRQKLTAEDVREMRRLRNNGETQVSLAHMFGVNQSSVSRTCSFDRRPYIS